MVAFTTLNRKLQKREDLHCFRSELDMRTESLRCRATERVKRQLADAIGIEDADLIDRLLKSGFTAETLPALSMAPVALVAWGEGYVTEEERLVALGAVYDSELSGNRAAIDLFQSWLDSRPDSGLLTLWADYRQTIAGNADENGQADSYPDWLVRVASKVAAASGGFLGMGAICKAEQEIIDRIEKFAVSHRTRAAY